MRDSLPPAAVAVRATIDRPPFDAAAPRFEAEAATLDVSPDQAERLRALGYADEPGPP